MQPTPFPIMLFVWKSMFLLLLGCGFALGIWWKLRSSRIVHTPVVLPRSKPRYLSEISWLTAPAVVLATFAGITSIHGFANGSGSETAKPRDRDHGLQASHQIRAVEPRILPVTAESLAQRPEWVQQERTSDGVTERVVISSQQYSTREEAERELTTSATELLLKDLHRLYPGEPRPRNWRPTGEEITRVAVKQQYVEAVERDFGTFTHPMYRVWWQLEISPEVRTEFLPGWRRGLTGTRITHVGIAASSLVLAVSLLSMFRRLDVQTLGKSRLKLVAMTGLIVWLWCLAIRFVPV